MVPDTLRKLLRYDPQTGDLYWKERGLSWFNDGKQPARITCASWNARCAGRKAFLAKNGHGYMHGAIFNKMYYAHRVIWAMEYGYWPDNIDHIDGLKDNNRLSNLRNVSTAENNRNLCVPSHNTSGTIGVYWHQRDKKWVAQIVKNGKKISCGRFHDYKSAVAARKKAETDNNFHANHGRAR